jgi:hypothetical protein
MSYGPRTVLPSTLRRTDASFATGMATAKSMRLRTRPDDHERINARSNVRTKMFATVRHAERLSRALEDATVGGSATLIWRT